MVVDARAAARRIVEQVLADHAAMSETSVTPTRPAVPDTPAWRAARRIVDEVLAAHGGGLVSAAEGAALASVTDAEEGPPPVLVQLEQATSEVVAQTVQRIVQREVAAESTRASGSFDPGSPEPRSSVTTAPPVDRGPTEVPSDPQPSPEPAPAAEPEPEAETEIVPELDDLEPEPADPEPAHPTYGGDVDAPADVARRIVAEVLAARASEPPPQDTVPPPVRPQPPLEPSPEPLEPPPPPVEPRPLPPVEPRPIPPVEPRPEPREPEPPPEPTEPEPEPVGVFAGPAAGRDLLVGEAPDHAVLPPPSRRTGRWLLATLLGAIALAWLFPLAVGALRDLVALSS